MQHNNPAPYSKPHSFQSPLSFIDTNTPIRMQLSPDEFHKLAQPETHRLKRRVTTVLDYNQRENYTQRVRISYKENIAPQEKRFTFTLRNNHQAKQTSQCQIPIQQPLTASISRMPPPLQRVTRPISVKPFELDLESFTRPSINHKKSHEEVLKDPQQSDFHKLKELGKGKFGTVWMVRHKKTNFLCAMKIIKKSVVREERVEHQVAKEIRIHNSLKHINIIAFYGYFHDEENFFILSEFATGGQVYSLLRKSHRLPESEVASIVKETADGLQMMHNLGFIHRDIKPENLILQFNTVKICDLGWAAQCSRSQMRKSICGTPLYYSPEVVKQTEYNSLIDVWTLGLLAYELLVGRIPFKIWSEFDLPVILEQEVTFPDYIDMEESTKNFILSCLTKNIACRPNLDYLKNHPFISNQVKDISFDIGKQLSRLF